MSTAHDRVIHELRTVALSDQASMTFTTVSPDTGRMHSCTTWFAPLIRSSGICLLSLSAPGPARIHSANIQGWEARGKLAEVSGAIREDGQVKNNPGCHGVAFHGEARTLRDPADVAQAIATFNLYNTFDAANLRKYLNHSTTQIPTHQVFEFALDEADIFDGRLGDNNPDRLVRLRWPAEQSPQDPLLA